MKKIIIIFLSILCLCGVGYFGYLAFSAKNIKSVEIAGKMQTLYVAGDKLDFEDADLKITYKNGDVKMLKMKDAKLKVTQFSTSTATEDAHRTMKITYKSYTIDVDYDVIKGGLYYLSSESYYVPGRENDPEQIDYNKATTSKYFYLRSGGECDYYFRDDSKLYMHDGSYDSDYNYTISGDTLVLTLGEDKANFKANYNADGTMRIVSTKTNTDDNGMVTSRVDNYYTQMSMRTDLVVKSATHEQISAYYFKRNETIATRTSEPKILLEVKYTNNDFASTVYVFVSDEMIVKGLDTSKAQYTTVAYGYYKENEFRIFYEVA